MTATIPAQVAELLGSLGARTGSVAGDLDFLGVKGIPGQCRSCPIANLLLQEVPGLTAVEVGAEEIHVWFRAGGETHLDHVDVPSLTQAFVLAFDHGQYPGLREVAA